jgi:hypothetical protein
MQPSCWKGQTVVSNFTPSGKAYRNRMLEDAIQVERDLRARSEGVIGRYREAMKKVAFALAGVDLENARLHNPDQINAWDPETWAAFLIEKVKKDNTSALSSDWDGTTKVEIPAGKNGTSAEELENAKRNIKELRLLLKQKEQDIKGLEEDVRSLSSENASLRKQPKRSQRSSEKQSAQRVVYGFHETIVDKLRALRIPNAPPAFKSRLVQSSPQRYGRQIKTLFVLSQFGLSNRMEIDSVISSAENISLRSFGVRRPIDELATEGLTSDETLELTKPFETSLKVLRLTEDGKRLCQAFGWDIIPSEWEKLIEGHQAEREKAHTLGILAFTMHARLRGWDVEVLPEIDGLSKPDVAVKNGDERYLVEIEGSAKPKDKKWKNLAEAHPQGKVAICTLAPEIRKQLVGDCKLAGISGVATDLKTLVFGEKGSAPMSIVNINAEMKLWYEQF